MRKYLLFLIIILFLASCSQGSNSAYPEGSNIPSPIKTIRATQTNTVVVIQPTITVSPTATASATLTLTPTIAGTPTISPEIMSYQCLEIADRPPKDHNMTGVIVSSLDDNTGAFSYDFDNSRAYYFQLEAGDRLLDFDVSPARNYVMYRHAIFSSDAQKYTSEKLVIATADANPVWSQDITGDYASREWINNEYILATWYADSDALLPNLTDLNPFTGDRQEFQPDFPGFATRDALHDLRWWAGNAKYDPTQTRVIYPECDEVCKDKLLQGERKYSVALLDLEQGEILARLVTRDSFGSTPIWSTDGRYAIMAANTTESYSQANEFYSISRDGEIRQITHFMDYFEEVEILRYSLSPDGKLIAFWIIAQPGPYESGQLAVLNIETGRVTNYCILGGPVMDNATPKSLSSPIWSSNSQQLLIVIRNPEDSSRIQTIMVDVNRGYAAKIADDTVPVGWMVAP